jgi:parallel beta-helix repeat protein
MRRHSRAAFRSRSKGPGLEPFRRGLAITSSGNTVRGLGVRGYANGIQVEGADNLITDVAVSGNRQGILVYGGAAMRTGNRIIGSPASGNVALGVAISSARAVVVENNRITGNGTSGVFIANADRVIVTDNVISENGWHGIEFSHEADLSGPPDPATDSGIAARNTITANAQAGILVGSADRFTITRNTISGNSRLGIDLEGGSEDEFGVTRNDSGDRDTGANQQLNVPFRLIAVNHGTATVVEGRVESPDPQSLTIELFVSDARDPSGFGEGERFAGTATPDARGQFRATLPAGLAGTWITATASDSTGNTSEFSEAVLLGAPRK